MHAPALLAAFFDTSHLVVAMCAAGAVVLPVGILAAKNDMAESRGLDKLVALKGPCIAAPLAVFGALHLFGTNFVAGIVPAYMPWRMFWAYFVGCALIAASLSIATRIGVRWSGLLFGAMMFLFVAMIHFPGALAQHDRILWVIVFREMSFGGAGWILAAHATDEGRGKKALMTVGCIVITVAVLFFGVEHFLHPTGLPGVPLKKLMPPWVPWPKLIDYVTGAALLAAGASVLLNRKTRTIAACVGGWILLMVLVIYSPVLIGALSEPGLGTKIEGINYFADTLLFGGAILALASAKRKENGH